MNLKRSPGLKLADAKKRQSPIAKRSSLQATQFSSDTMSSRTTSRTSTASKGFICSGCNKAIKRDKFLLKACDKYWHENCLRCDRCHSRLGELGSTLYCKSNMNLCRQDYLEMFGETGVCSVCEKLISASEMVMRARENVYHLECFACQLCSQRFCVGDRFYLCENKVVCQYDYEEHILPIQRSLVEQQQPPPTLQHFEPNSSASYILLSSESGLNRQDQPLEAPTAASLDEEKVKELTRLESVHEFKEVTPACGNLVEPAELPDESQGRESR